MRSKRSVGSHADSPFAHGRAGTRSAPSNQVSNDRPATTDTGGGTRTAHSSSWPRFESTGVCRCSLTRKRLSRRANCRIKPYLIKRRRCAAPGPASAPGSAFRRPARRTPGRTHIPQLISQAHHHTSVLQSSRVLGASLSRSPAPESGPPYGRRMRSASPSPDTAPVLKASAPITKTETHGRGRLQTSTNLTSDDREMDGTAYITRPSRMDFLVWCSTIAQR